MKVQVKPLIGGTLSNFISMTYGQLMPEDEASIMNYCQQMGEVYVGYIDDVPICVWGLIPPSFLSMQAYLWMWCKADMVEHPFVFIRQSQIQVKKMLERYSMITGVTAIGNRKAIAWLRWLGAEFADYPDHGRLHFTIRRPE